MSDDSSLHDGAANDDDRSFERLLLRSAERDGPRAGASAAAFANFSRASGVLVVSESVAHGLVAKATFGKALVLSAAALVGSAVTLVVLWPWAEHESSTSAAALTSHSVSAAETPSPSTPDAHSVPAGAPQPPASSLAEMPGRQGVAEAPAIAEYSRPRANAAAGKQTTSGDARSTSAGPVTADSSGANSTLLREVLALDAIRGSLGRAAFDEALHRVEAFHAEFPRAQLAADAEALGVRALEAKHENIAAKRRAERFLERYPNDPHAGRVQPKAE